MTIRVPVALALSWFALESSTSQAAQNATAPPIVAPAVYRGGAMPAQPVLGVGGGEVIIELTVSDAGSVINARPLRVTASFTELVAGAVKSWRFTPAEELVDPASRKPGDGPTRAIESKVIVAAVFRPPSLYTGTLGAPVQDVARASTDVPFPLATVMPTYPPNVRDAGVVLVEAKVTAEGKVADAKVKSSAASLDEPALAAARQWTFRGVPGSLRTGSRAYLIFGFQVPVGLGSSSQVPADPRGSSQVPPTGRTTR